MKFKLNNQLKFRIIFISFFVFIALIVYVLGLFQSNEIEHNRSFTKGRITGAQCLFKPPAYDLKFTYSVDREFFENISSGVTIAKGNVKYFAWKEFPVIYSRKHPNKCEILIFPDHFKAWGIPFPDSLNWVLKYEKY